MEWKGYKVKEKRIKGMYTNDSSSLYEMTLKACVRGHQTRNIK